MNVVTSDPPRKTINLSLDYRMIIVLLLVVIVGLIAYCRPWEPRYGNNARTIAVTGKATLSAAPDEFVFNPTYEFTNADQKAALAALSAKSNELVGRLKGLGVPASDIKTNADSYNGYVVPVYPIKGNGNPQPAYTLRVTVTLADSKLVQKVQDYLVSTTPTGQVSPRAEFSDAMQNQLEAQARDGATKDARSKAEQSAKNLGFRLGAVKNVQDGEGFGGIMPLQAGATSADYATGDQSLVVEPGQNKLSYTVNVTYFLC
jgi:uncharacterized protein YggE